MTLLPAANRSALRVAPILLASIVSASAAGARVTVIESDARHVVVEIVPPSAKSTAVVTSTGSYVRLRIDGFGEWGELGAPEIPTTSTRVALPPDARPRLVVREEEWSAPLAGAIVPVAERVGVRETFGANRVVEREPEPGAAFRTRALVPETPFSLSGIAGLRHLQTVSVIVHGARADMASRTHRLLKRAVLEVVFEEKAPELRDGESGFLRPTPRPAPHDDLWERTIRGSVVNADRAAPWRVGGPGDGALVGDAPWGAGSQWKILVPGTGLAEITYEALSAAGLPFGIDVDHVVLYQRTFDLDEVDDPGTAAGALFVPLPVPIRVNDANSDGFFGPGDSFWFYGRSFRDQWMTTGSEHEDQFGQDNFVWLRIDPAGGARMATVRPSGSLSGAATDSLASTPSRILVEKDTRYYRRPPDTISGSRTFETEFGYRNDAQSPVDSTLGWILQSDTFPYDAFDVLDPVQSPRDSLTLRVTGGGSPIDHIYTTRFESTLNDRVPPIAEKSFYNATLYSGGIVPPANMLHTFPIPAGALVHGQNRFSFRGWSYRGNTTNPDFWFPVTRFFFDWFRVRYDRALVARGDQLILSTENGPASVVLARVVGFAGPDLRLFDVTDPAAPAEVGVAPAQIVPDGGGFALRFDHDNATGPHRFVAIRASEIPEIPASAIQTVSQGTLLAGGNGARWVGLTHDGFLAGAQELATHRSARMSAIVAPLSQVWDVFNNGMRDPHAMKAYAAYAFHRWSEPLAFLCLVGDASEDHRGLYSQSDPDFVPSHSLHASYEGEPEETDQYYAEVTHGAPADPDGFDDLSDLYVGRLAVTTAEELEWNIERILQYEAPATGDDAWRRRVLLTADDAFSGDLGNTFGVDGYRYQGNETSFRESSDLYADSLAALPFDAVVPVKVYLSDFTMGCPDSCYDQDTDDCENGLGRDCGTYYDCRNPADWGAEWRCMREHAEITYLPALREAIDRGALMWNFEGHANKAWLAHEEIFRDDAQRRDIDVLDNGGMPFIFLGFACHLAEFDDVDEATTGDSIAEKLLNKRPSGEGSQGGAIGAFASSGFEFLSPNLLYNDFVFESFFHPERSMHTGTLPDGPGEGGVYGWTLGESTTRARLMYQDAFPPSSFDRDRQASQRFVLLGDPAVTPDVGTPEIRVTVNGVSVGNGEFLDVPEGPSAPIDIAATVRHGRGIGNLRVIDSVRGVVPPAEVSVAVSDSTTDGVARAMTLAYAHPLRVDTYDLVIEATNENGAVGRFMLRVSSELTILDLTPFPNPFADELRLYYRLTRSADEVRARIFTISGRKIYDSTEAPALADVNMFTWDGRDDGGNSVANGTYLLKLRASSPEGDSEAITRVVKMR